MSIPGDLLPDLSSSDASISIPIPKVSGANAYMQKRSRDEMIQSKEDASGKGAVADLGVLPLGQMSLVDFAHVINSRLDLYEQDSEHAALMDALMNRQFSQRLAQSSRSLRSFRRLLLSHLSRWHALEEEVRDFIERLNSAIELYNSELECDRTELKQFGVAISEYSDPSGSAYGQEELLRLATERYTLYRDGLPGGAGRNDTISGLNALIEDYHARAKQLNCLIEELNLERQPYSVPIQPLLFLPLAAELPPVDPRPLAGYFETFLALLAPIPLLEPRIAPKPVKFMSQLYDPVHYATIGYMNNLSNLFDMADEYAKYEHFIGRSLNGDFWNQHLMDFAKIYLELLGGENASVSVLRTGISWTTLNRLLARASITASMFEAKIPLLPAEIDELQLMILNFLSKISMQSSTGPAFHILGNDLGRVGIGEEHLSTTLALTFIKRLRSVIQSGVISENLTFWIEESPRLSAFPESNRKLLVERLASIFALALLQSGLVQASISLGVPSLAGQILGIALSEAGIHKTISLPTFNDALNDSSIAFVIQAQLVEDLRQHGFAPELAASVIFSAYGKAVENTPFSSLEHFTYNLAMQLNLSGISDIELANALAARASECLLITAPNSLVVEHPFKFSLSMGLVNPLHLLTPTAVDFVLKGLDKKILEPIYRKAVEALYGAVDLVELVTYFATPPLLRNQDASPPPRNARQVLLKLYESLVDQGVSVDEAIQIAEQFLVILLRSKGTQAAFKLTPQTLSMVQSSFQDLFTYLGLPFSKAKALSVELVEASLPSLQELSNHALLGQVDRAIEVICSAKDNFLERAAYSILNNYFSLGSEVLLDVSRTIADSVAGEGAFVVDLASLTGAMRRALLKVNSLALTPSQASRLANEIALAAAEKDALAKEVGAYGGALSGSVAAWMINPANDAFLLAEALKGEGAGSSLAVSLSRVLAPHLRGMSVKSNLKKARKMPRVNEEEQAQKPEFSAPKNLLINGRDAPLFSANGSKTLTQEELRELIGNIIFDQFKDAVPQDKARRISEEFILSMMGLLFGKEEREGEVSLLGLVKEQVEKLVKQPKSKHYRRIMMNGILDMMTNSSNISFDTFLFTELLNFNGKVFLKLIQGVLLNNIGLEDRSIDKTINLQI